MVCGFKPSLTEEMGEGINTEGTVVDQNGANKETPDEHLKSRGAECWVVYVQDHAEIVTKNGEEYWGNDIVLIEPP